MIPTASFITCSITLFVTLILPVLVLMVFAAKNRKQGICSAWFLGAAGFFVTQILIRVPILTYLQTQDWFLTFAQEHLFLYIFSLAFTAGLFELAGRFAAAKLMRKNLTYKRSLAAGLGHGGIEAMVIVGITYINNLVYMVMIQSGTFEPILAQAAATGVDVSQLYAIQDSLIHTSPVLFLMAGLERVLTIVAHTALSMLVCYGVHTGKTWKGLLVCLGIHTFIDTCSVISLLPTESGGNVLSQTAAYLIVYTILIAVAAVSLLILKKIQGAWQDEPQKEAVL